MLARPTFLSTSTNVRTSAGEPTPSMPRPLSGSAITRSTCSASMNAARRVRASSSVTQSDARCTSIRGLAQDRCGHDACLRSSCGGRAPAVLVSMMSTRSGSDTFQPNQSMPRQGGRRHRSRMLSSLSQPALRSVRDRQRRKHVVTRPDQRLGPCDELSDERLQR